MTNNSVLDTPFEKLTKAQLKAGIRMKFGNAARFCKLVGRDVYQFNKLFILKDSDDVKAQLMQVYEQARNTDNAPVKGELSDELRREIKSAIFKESDNIQAFCEENGFSNTWVSTVLRGKVVKVTPKVKELAKALNLNIAA